MYNNESSIGLVPEIVAPDVDAQRVRFAIGGLLAGSGPMSWDGVPSAALPVLDRHRFSGTP